MSVELHTYAALLADVKTRIAGAQTRAALAANRELLTLYWEVGRLIDARQAEEGWGARVIPRLAADLARELPDARGFSERNLKRMLRFAREYPAVPVHEAALVPQAVAPHEVGPAGLVPQAVAPAKAGLAALAPQAVGSGGDTPETAGSAFWSLPWGHHVLLFERVPDPVERSWYVRASVAEGWSRDVLGLMIKSRAHERSGAAVTNFEATLPPAQSDLARQTLKDPYVFDFLALDAGYRERELETGLLAHLERFLIELGVGFAFVGRQVRLPLEDDEYFVDLLFYHLKLRCFVVVELKIGPFKAEHAGKMNLYLNLVDDTMRHPADAPSIKLILCQDRKKVLAEYALRGLDKPIGISEYELTRALPTELASALPTIAEIEAELTEDLVAEGARADGEGTS